MEKVSIPRDRDGYNKSYGFVTYKHANSVHYAMNLFNNTTLFRRVIKMNPRNKMELPPITNSQDHSLKNNSSHMKTDTCGTNMLPSTGSQSKHVDVYSHKDDRRSRRAHPYDREQSKIDNHHKDHRLKNNQNNHRSNNYSRKDYKSSRHDFVL